MIADSLELTGGDVTVYCGECDAVLTVKHTAFTKPVSIQDDGDTEHKSTCVTRCRCGNEIKVELGVWSCNGYSTHNAVKCEDDECSNHLEFELKRNY